MRAEHKREALLRLRTIRGHLDGLIRMVEQEVYCPDLMKQVGAVQASLERVNRVLLRNHLETCVTEAIQSGSGEAKIAELLDALRFTGALTDFKDRFEPAPVDQPVDGLPDGPGEASCCPAEVERTP